jgi:DNA-binding NarL/FixJ family response regulator
MINPRTNPLALTQRIRSLVPNLPTQDKDDCVSFVVLCCLQKDNTSLRFIKWRIKDFLHHQPRELLLLCEGEYLDPHPLDDVDQLNYLTRNLSNRERYILYYHYYQDLPSQEIARRLGLTPSLVQHTLSNTLSKLRKEEQ